IGADRQAETVMHMIRLISRFVTTPKHQALAAEIENHRVWAFQFCKEKSPQQPSSLGFARQMFAHLLNLPCSQKLWLKLLVTTTRDFKKVGFFFLAVCYNGLSRY